MLYLENPANTFTAWRGARINDISYPLDIETKWTAEELAAIGLYQPQAGDPASTGQVVSGSTVERVSGTVKYVNTYADATIPQSVTAAQFQIALNAHSLLDSFDTLVASASKEVQIWWSKAPDIRRDNTRLIEVAKTQGGYTDAQIDAFFVEASGY